MPHLNIHSPVGSLTLFEEYGALIAIEWGRGSNSNLGSTPLLTRAKVQLEEYFGGARKQFDLRLRPEGSVFQQAVWRCMTEIPHGEVRTYGDLAYNLNSAPRAVGGACGRNPIPIIIPCHRVVGAGGKLTGFSGGNGTDTKKMLLGLENANLASLFESPRTR